MNAALPGEELIEAGLKDLHAGLRYDSCFVGRDRLAEIEAIGTHTS